MSDVSNTFVIVMGLAVVFIGLIGLIVLSYIMSALCRIKLGAARAGAAPAADAAPAAVESIPNRQAMIAAVSAAIAEDLGTDLSGIRILSVKKI